MGTVTRINATLSLDDEFAILTFVRSLSDNLRSV